MGSLPKGRAARGKAGIFGGSISPLQYYLQQGATRDRQRALQAQQDRENRDKTLDYMDKFNPSSKFSQLNYKINEAAQKMVREPVMEALNQGYGPSYIRQRAQFNQGQVMSLVSEADEWKNQLDSVQAEIEKDPFRYNDKAKSLLRDVYLNNDGTVKDFDSIREGMNSLQALRFDPKALNQEGVMRKFTESLPEQNRVLLSKTYSDMGYGPDEIETMVKSGLQYEMKLDPVSKRYTPVLDDNLMPKVIVDEGVYRLAKADPWVNSLMTSAAQDKAGQMRWLKQNISGAGDAVSITSKTLQGRKQDETSDPRNSAWGIDFGVPVANIEARRDWLDKATSGNRPDLLKAIGNATKDIRADYSTDKKKIIISFPSGLEDPNLMNNPNLAGIMISPGKAKGTYELDISNPQAKRAARQALSEIVDSQLRDSKQAIGTDNYVRYEEAYAKNKQKGASGIKWK